jgi:hypothetical protein
MKQKVYKVGFILLEMIEREAVVTYLKIHLEWLRISTETAIKIYRLRNLTTPKIAKITASWYVGRECAIYAECCAVWGERS